MRWLIALFILFVCTPAYAGLVNVNSNIIQYQPSSSNSPGGEAASNAFDGSASTKYLNFDKQNMGVGIKLSTGRPVSAVGFITANDSSGRDPMTFSLYGSNNGVDWFILTQNTSTQLSTGRYAQSPIITLSNTNAYAYYYIKFPTMRNTGDNSIQIGEIQLLYESTSTRTSTATGSMTLSGVNNATVPTAAPTYPAATISASQQTSINQTLSKHNSVYIDQSAGNNTYVKVTQTGDYNIIKATITGYNQSLTVTQTGNYNYEESIITGGYNILNNTQLGNNKALFQNVSGSNNSITTSQSGGNHFLELNIPTNGNTVSVTQSGNAQKLFSLTINSPNVGVTVSQTNATTGDSAAMSITCNTGPCNGYTYTRN